MFVIDETWHKDDTVKLQNAMFRHLEIKSYKEQTFSVSVSSLHASCAATKGIEYTRHVCAHAFILYNSGEASLQRVSLLQHTFNGAPTITLQWHHCCWLAQLLFLVASYNIFAT